MRAFIKAFMVATVTLSEFPLQTPLLLLLLIGCCHHSDAFLPVGDDVNMDFLSNDSRAKADLESMMLMNSDDPKLKAAAEEAFEEIMKAKRLTKLQECRRSCVVDYEDSEAFRRCNERCEASNKPGEYRDLPNLSGEAKKPAPAPAVAEKPEEKVEKPTEGAQQKPADQTEPKEKSTESKEL